MTFILREQEQLITMKKEATYATDSVPTAADALLVSDISIKPLEMTSEERKNIAGFMGSQGSVSTGVHVSGSFNVELAGSGVAGDLPGYQRCYLSAGVAAVESVDNIAYNLIDTGYESDSIAWYVGNHKHKIIGVMSAFEWTLGAGAIPKLKCSFKGLYLKPVEDAQPVGVDLSNFMLPVGVSDRSVSLFNFFGVAVAMKDLSVNPGINVAYQNLVNYESIAITGRAGSVSLKFREPALSMINFYDLTERNQMGAMNYQLGTDVTDAGHIFELAVPNVQLKSVDRSWDDGLSYLSVQADIVPLSKNSDLTWKHR